MSVYVNTVETEFTEWFTPCIMTETMWSTLHRRDHLSSRPITVNERKQSRSTSLCGAREGEALSVEVFTEDPRPEDPGPDPGPVRVRVYILNGQPGPGRVPIYYFGSRVCLTLCVIPESIGEHRTCQWSVSVGTLCVFCNLKLVKLGWEKYERE